MTTPIPLVVILAILAVCWAWGGTFAWLEDQYEFRWFGVSRRWYGTHARVCLHTVDRADAGLYVVLDRDDEDMPQPSLKVCKLSPGNLRYWDEDAEPFWAPVTHFAPHSVRRCRPHLERFGRVAVPWLTSYVPLSQPVGYLGGQP